MKEGGVARPRGAYQGQEGQEARHTSNNNMESISKLSIIGSRLIGNRCSPEDTLDIGDGSRVRAPDRIRIQRWVTLVVDVEAGAADSLGAVGRALGWIVGGEQGTAHVGRGLGGASAVDEGAGVVPGGCGGDGGGGEDDVVAEGGGGVGARGCQMYVG